MATEWSSLIPESVARDVIAAAADESAVLALGNVVVMPSGRDERAGRERRAVGRVRRDRSS
jgi:hypothetical protein